MAQIGEIAKTVYGSGEIVKVSAASVWVMVNGRRVKITTKQFEIMNGE